MNNLLALVVVLPTIEPPDATTDVNHETQPSAIRDEEGGSGTTCSIMEKFLPFELRLAICGVVSEHTYGHIPSRPGQRDSVHECS